MKRLLSLSLLLLLWSTDSLRQRTLAQEPDDNKKEPLDGVLYVGGSATIPKQVVGVLDVEDNQALRISWKGGRWELPYERIQVLYVSVSRPSAMVELGGLSAWFLIAAIKGKKCYLSVQYEEPNERPKKCFFVMKGKGVKQVMDTLEKKSTRPVVFESEEARRRIAGR